MRFILSLFVLAFVVAVAGLGFHWTVNRVYVPEGMSLLLRYKGPFVMPDKGKAKTGNWAEEGETGVLEKLRGPGRHFYCPLWWERKLVSDFVIEPGQVGLVTCKLGKSLPAGQYLVEGDIGTTEYKGVLRKALGPGRYRINPYGYEVKVVGTEKKTDGNQTKYSGWVEIPTGYVGVITNLADNPALNQTKGVQDNVFPPGIYPINGREQQIDIVEIGYRETTVAVGKVRNAEVL